MTKSIKELRWNFKRTVVYQRRDKDPDYVHKRTISLRQIHDIIFLIKITDTSMNISDIHSFTTLRLLRRCMIHL